MVCLAGSFFTSLPLPSIERAETSLQQQWSDFLSSGFKVTPLEEDLILFDFKKEEDAKKVLVEGPWNVDGVILVLKQLDSSDINIDFSVACFWVKAEGLPLYYYTFEDFEKDIAKKLSDKPLISSDIDDSKKAFWVRVEVDLRQPLKAGFFIRGQRRPRYVQFKYKKLGNFCDVCGKIDHTYCNTTPKERPLTRQFWTRTYGPWLSYDYGLMVRNSSSSSVKFEFDFSEKKPISEEAAEAELVVEFKIDVVYISTHEWLGKTLTRSFVDKEERHCFRLPLSLLIAETISNHTMVYEILSSQIEEIVPLVGLRSSEKDSVIRKFLDYLMKNKKKWSSRRRRWVPLRAQVTKQIMIPIVECETMLKERRDDELKGKIDSKISGLIKTRVEGNEHRQSVSRWVEHIKEALGEIGVIMDESDLETEATNARDKAIDMERLWQKGQKPANTRRVEELETVEILGQEMSSCMICEDEIFPGEEATRMPCSHFFHKECLQAWLKTANSCPLCRFQLPN